jgi:hypothetical protein
MADIATQVAALIDGLNLSHSQIETLTQNLTDLRKLAILELDTDVAKAKGGTHLTRHGFELLAKALAGKELHYTRIKLGDSMNGSDLVEPTLEEQYEFNDLIHHRDFDVPMVGIDRPGGGMVSVSFRVNNANIPEGFWLREMGLFALDPDTDEEILYAYRNTGVLSEWVPDSSARTVYDVILTLVTVIQEAENVTAVIDMGLAYVTQAEFQEHINSTRPHPNSPTLGDEITTTKYFWAQDDDINLHPISTDNTRRLILGGDAADIPKMDRRLTQTEINIANLYAQLNAEREMGLKPNLMLIDDFIDADNTDLYNCRVIAQAAGIAEIELDDDKNILNGCWYTITDGLQNEYVQVRSVAKNGGKTIVMFNQLLNNTYNLDNTFLMRTTSLIYDGYALGAGDLRGKTYTFAETWQGIGANATETQILLTTQSNIDNFELRGNTAFTANGEFTLAEMVPHVFSADNHRAALAVTVNGTIGDFGVFSKDETVPLTIPGTEYYASLIKITATQPNTTLIGGKNANTFEFVGGEYNSATGGLGKDTFMFNSCGGEITDFGVANALKNADGTVYAKTTTADNYNRTNPLSYAEGADILKVNGTVTRIAIDKFSDDSSVNDQTFCAIIYYTDINGNQHTVTLKNIVKPLYSTHHSSGTHGDYDSNVTAAKSLNICDMRSGDYNNLSTANISNLLTAKD